MKIITAYWCNINNFGDLITPALIKYYGGIPKHAPFNTAQLVSTGSILGHIDNEYSGIILGSGFGKVDINRNFPNADIVGVRGCLSEAKLKLKNSVLGDPGLLLPKLYTPSSKEFTIGIVPHYVDADNPAIKKIKTNDIKNDILVIDVRRPPKEVFVDISKCEFILSSSLHGLIVADSLNIPNGWLELSDKVRGGGYKFRDHFTVSGSKQKTSHNLNGSESINHLRKLTYDVSPKVSDIQDVLDDKYRQTIKDLL